MHCERFKHVQVNVTVMPTYGLGGFDLILMERKKVGVKHNLGSFFVNVWVMKRSQQRKGKF